MKKKAIFIAATGQNVGKTTICLGILAALKKRFSSIGFIKPVGQRHVVLENGVAVDKDVVLFKEYFNLTSDYATMSPVLSPQGFTRDFLDKKVDETALFKKITHSFSTVCQDHPYVLVEGTGHVGVGSIFNLNNAKVAKTLGLDIVLIATGGLGSAIDELALNIEMCKHYGIDVRGVILNRVLEEKRQMILSYFPKALERWNIPLLGAIPFLPYLNIPMMKDYEGLLKAPLLTGKEFRFRHFNEIKLIAGSLESYLKEMGQGQLIITPACRLDIIDAVISAHEEAEISGKDMQGGLILTGKNVPKESVMEKLQKAKLPILYAPYCSFDVMKMISTFCAKIQKDDTPKVEKAIDLVERNIDIEALISAVEA